jgi:predicted flap endonuclease-1-like 5' DNA nuclease
MFTLNPLAGRSKGRSWFWWGINIGIGLAIFAWWWLEQQSKDSRPSPVQKVKSVLLPDEPMVSEPQAVAEPEEPVTAVELQAPDDLRKIEGIGPKSENVLLNAKVKTYADLADLTPVEIKVILTEAGMRIGFPETWPEQAALAAAGKWDELAALQATLVGGRRVP